ncbi:NAD-dependent epimerase/dehydratase family protein [Seongchinamella sediminis]|uniref:NAD-dependent epimerase/dehydratase family protein n=1 Tax=Seongchinamella sediminis TaxID=2283635 RepID=A0A3L7DVG2_9GAMM|nr:SDR family oxidoreductase [Seongchinamella sediminis]RLQ20775.1 NAD-dependent epimerase/dehydratase family protein [Seongchinamella sediminis]
MPERIVLITGATGAVGSAVVPVFLEDPATTVYLLMRADSEAHLQQRLRDLLAFWQPEMKVDEALLARIRPLRGDVSEPRLGLTSDEYETLAGELTHIVHSAANVKMNMSSEEARKISVDSAREIAALAEACQANGQFCKLEYISTIGVAGRLRGLVPERPLSEPREFHNTYESSKAEAEAFILGRMEAGLPATVHRPSMVVGDSRTGKIIHFQVFYHLCTFLSGRHTHGVLPNLEGSCLDIVPCDYVARAIVGSSGQLDLVGEILHLCSGPEHAISLTDLQARVAKTFSENGTAPRTVTVPAAMFKLLVSGLGLVAGIKGARSLGALSILLDYLEESRVQFFDSTQTRALLARQGITLPPAETYVQGVLRYYLQSKYPG